MPGTGPGIATKRTNGLAPSRLRRPGAAWRRRGGGALVLVTEVDPSLGEIIGRQLDGDAIAGEDADAILLHLAGGIGEGLMAIVETNAEPRVRQELGHHAVEFDQVFLGQSGSSSLWR